MTVTGRGTFPEHAAIREILDAGRVPHDGVLLVHSAFKELSRAGFDAGRFIEALLVRLEKGTLLMPAMTWRTINPERPYWDEMNTASHVGILAEVFRTRYAVARSIHPTHSVSGYGRGLEALFAGHHIDDTPCSANSPWGRLADAGAHILMLGVGMEHCTALHHPEEIVAPDLYLSPPGEAGSYHCTRRDGTALTVLMRRHLKLSRDFPQYDHRLGRRDLICTGQIYGVEWRLMRARDLIEDAFANLRARGTAHIAGVADVSDIRTAGLRSSRSGPLT